MEKKQIEGKLKNLISWMQSMWEKANTEHERWYETDTTYGDTDLDASAVEYGKMETFDTIMHELQKVVDAMQPPAPLSPIEKIKLALNQGAEVLTHEHLGKFNTKAGFGPGRRTITAISGSPGDWHLKVYLLGFYPWKLFAPNAGDFLINQTPLSEWLPDGHPDKKTCSLDTIYQILWDSNQLTGELWGVLSEAIKDLETNG